MIGSYEILCLTISQNEQLILGQSLKNPKNRFSIFTFIFVKTLFQLGLPALVLQSDVRTSRHQKQQKLFRVYLRILQCIARAALN